MRDLAIGDEVKFAKPFLKSIGAGATDPMWFAQGTIARIVDIGLILAEISWKNAGSVDCYWCNGSGLEADKAPCAQCNGKGYAQEFASKVNVKNLHRVGTFSASEA